MHCPEKQLAESAGWHDLCQLSAAEKLWQLFLASDAQAFFMRLKMSGQEKGKAQGQEETPSIKMGPGRGQVGATCTFSHVVIVYCQRCSTDRGLKLIHTHTHVSRLQEFYRLPCNQSFHCHCHICNQSFLHQGDDSQGSSIWTEACHIEFQTPYSSCPVLFLSRGIITF